MNGEMFEAIVKARADEAAKNRIRDFKRSINNALATLLGVYAIAPESYNVRKYPADQENKAICRADKYTGLAREVLERLASDDVDKGWPKELWTREDNKARDELLRSLGEFQAAFTIAGAKGKPTPGDAE
jgi:hypothetical protein